MRLCIDHSVQAIGNVGVPTAQAVGSVPRPAALKQKANLINNGTAAVLLFFSSLLFSHRRLRISSAVSRISHLASDSLSRVCSSLLIFLNPLSLSPLSHNSYLSGTPFSSPDWKSTQFAQAAVSLLSHSTQRERCSLDHFLLLLRTLFDLLH